MKLTRTQREAIFDKTSKIVETRYFDPHFNGKEWPAIARRNRSEILAIDDPEKFETAMHQLVRQLGTSHTGFFHESLHRVPGRLAICATFRKHETAEGNYWMFQDVHEGGPAARAGIRPLDLLLAINQKRIAPPEQPTFPMGAEATVTIRKFDDGDVLLKLPIPKPRSRRTPYAEPKAIVHRKLEGNVGYLKAVIFPGLLGIDVAREIDHAVRALGDCDRLIIDLRGHLGGGLGVLRLMSYLTPDRVPIGYTVTRRMAGRGYVKERLPRFGHIPSSKWGVLPLAFRFMGRDESVVLMTEGLGPQKFHGKIVLLVNQHTASAGEMVCAFASENKLATIVGVQTAGRLLGGKGYKVGYGYLAILPGAAFFTWQGRSFEGQGVVPDLMVPWSDDIAEKAIITNSRLPLEWFGLYRYSRADG
ncbi:MAG TPA: S41 family peptidase [Terriglobia bacterium]|nr:S41 family peptidase [Terriglobia bacterium]